MAFENLPHILKMIPQHPRTKIFDKCVLLVLSYLVLKLQTMESNEWIRQKKSNRYYKVNLTPQMGLRMPCPKSQRQPIERQNFTWWPWTGRRGRLVIMRWYYDVKIVAGWWKDKEKPMFNTGRERDDNNIKVGDSFFCHELKSLND